MAAAEWTRVLTRNPVIAGVRSVEEFDAALTSPVDVIFLLNGSLSAIDTILERAGNKLLFIHLDLLDGLSRDLHGLRYLARQFAPFGIITTRTQLIKEARQLGLATVQRLFILDSQALQKAGEVVADARPDLLEVLPGRLPEALLELRSSAACPIIAGGLIRSREHVVQALESGAIAVSTSEQRLWKVGSTFAGPGHGRG